MSASKIIIVRVLILMMCSCCVSCKKNDTPTNSQPSNTPSSNTNNKLVVAFDYSVSGTQVMVTDKSVNNDISYFHIINSVHGLRETKILSSGDSKTFTIDNHCGCDVTIKLVSQKGFNPKIESQDSVSKTISMVPISTKIVEVASYKYISATQTKYLGRTEGAAVYLFKTFEDMKGFVNPVLGPFITDKNGQTNLINQPVGKYYIRAQKDAINSFVYYSENDNIIDLGPTDCHFHSSTLSIDYPL